MREFWSHYLNDLCDQIFSHGRNNIVAHECRWLWDLICFIFMWFVRKLTRRVCATCWPPAMSSKPAMRIHQRPGFVEFVDIVAHMVWRRQSPWQRQPPSQPRVPLSNWVHHWLSNPWCDFFFRLFSCKCTLVCVCVSAVRAKYHNW